MTREEFLKQVNEKLNATVENVKNANVAIDNLHKQFPKTQLETNIDIQNDAAKNNKIRKSN